MPGRRLSSAPDAARLRPRLRLAADAHRAAADLLDVQDDVVADDDALADAARDAQHGSSLDPVSAGGRKSSGACAQSPYDPVANSGARTSTSGASLMIWNASGPSAPGATTIGARRFTVKSS